jgi:long-chain acyl-CoA synthetase
MTEIAGVGTTHPLYGPNQHGSIGCAVPYCSIRVCDSEDPNKVLNKEEVGELQIKGPITMMGYFADEKKTKETLLPDGWLRTGDLAKIDENGCAYKCPREIQFVKDVPKTSPGKILRRELHTLDSPG